MPRSSPDAIDRREALRRAALVLGGVLSAPMVAGVLAGCEARRAPAAAWRPRALTPDQTELVATIAEHILPETDTPGARAVGVHRFIDAMLAEAYSTQERPPSAAPARPTVAASWNARRPSRSRCSRRWTARPTPPSVP